MASSGCATDQPLKVLPLLEEYSGSLSFHGPIHRVKSTVAQTLPSADPYAAQPALDIVSCRFLGRFSEMQLFFPGMRNILYNGRIQPL